MIVFRDKTYSKNFFYNRLAEHLRKREGERKRGSQILIFTKLLITLLSALILSRIRERSMRVQSRMSGTFSGKKPLNKS